MIHFVLYLIHYNQKDGKKRKRSRKNSANSKCYLDFFLFRVHEHQQNILLGSKSSIRK